MAQAVQTFLTRHEERIAPIRKKIAIAYWDATGKGDQEKYDDYARYQLQLQSVYANADEFRQVKTFRKILRSRTR